MNLLVNNIPESDLREISEKVFAGERISTDEGLILYKKASLPLLGILAVTVKKRLSGNKAYFNHNFHIEPTNKCVYNCRFCSYHKQEGDPESWEYSHEQMLDIVKSFDSKPVTEVHIVGGVHPAYDIYYWGSLLQKISKYRPELHIKAFSAIELDYMISKAGMSVEEGLKYLKGCGLNSIPGGGAEIFDEELRKQICDDKASSEMWLNIHETAHMAGIPSNATILYGHIETYANRIDHMDRLRKLQDRTKGFNCFIPLKFRKENNNMSYLGEVSVVEDLKNYAVSRIFLDNFPHLKAYWPMIGKEAARLSLSFGVDDMDGTIDDTTRIYSMAGAGDTSPAMSTEEICNLIRETGMEPVERDSVYNTVKDW